MRGGERPPPPGLRGVSAGHASRATARPADSGQGAKGLAGSGGRRAHTIDHIDVTTISGSELRHQIADSRKILQQKFGIPVDFFCYPAGVYDDAAIAEVKRAGYEGATTVDPGLATPDEDPYTLKRIRVDGGEGADGLRQSLIDNGVEMPSS